MRTLSRQSCHMDTATVGAISNDKVDVCCRVWTREEGWLRIIEVTGTCERTASHQEAEQTLQIAFHLGYLQRMLFLCGIRALRST